MPRAMPPIPAGVPIADKDGGITTFFRLRWQQLVDGWAQSGSVQRFSAPARTAAVSVTAIHTTLASGLYRLTWYLRKTRADGVASSLTASFGFVDLDSQTLFYTGAALTVDTVSAWQSDTKLIRCLGSTDITFAVTYSSTTAGQMRYDLEVALEFLP